MSAPLRLCRAALPQLAPHTMGPLSDDFHIGIVHLGVGNFQRAHQAVYTEGAMLAAGGDWGICGVSLRSAAMRDALAPQDGLYSLIVRDGTGRSTTVHRALRQILVAPENPQAVLDRLCDPRVRIVTLTVTEKGYCRDPSGGLDARHPAIEHDLRSPAAPMSALGFLLAALRRRRSRGHAPFTVVSCDNLVGNGATLRRVCVEYADLRDADLARWIEHEVAFPSTAVDRIVPASTDVDRDEAAVDLGLTDAWPVATEPYSLWVIEDRFPAGRPAWDAAGALLVADVTPFEQAKLRMLNGTHSTIAYLSVLAGYELVSDAMAVPALRRLIEELMSEEIEPTLAVPLDFDLHKYRGSLLERFANPALKHRCAQIAMDGSQKLPPRLLGTIADRLAAGLPIRRLGLSVAAWMRFLQARSDAGVVYRIDDPLGDRLAELARPADNAAALYSAIVAGSGVIPPELATQPKFKSSVLAALESLMRDGARQTITVWAANAAEPEKTLR
jgi:fructuronate reductase